MNSRACVWAAVSAATILLCLNSACARQGDSTSGPPPGAPELLGPAASPCVGESTEVSAWREQLKVERSFAAFVAGIRGSRLKSLPWDAAGWDKVRVLYDQYQAAVKAAAATLPDEGAGDEATEDRLVALERTFANLRELRFQLSAALAEHVVGLDPAKKDEALDDGNVLEAIRSGREPIRPVGTGEAPDQGQAAVLDKLRQLDPRARDEVSFGWLVDAMWEYGPVGTSGEFRDGWRKQFGLVSSYTTGTSTYGGIPWSYIQPKGLRQPAAKMQEMLELSKSELARLRQQRFSVSEAILKDVFGISDPDLLHEVATGEDPQR